MAVANLSSVIGKDVYTKGGKFIGKVDDAMLDTERGAIYGLVIQMARDSFVYKFFEQEGGGAKKAILIPHRHLLAAEDIILVSMPEKYQAAQVPRPEAAHEAAPEPEAMPEPEPSLDSEL